MRSGRSPDSADGPRAAGALRADAGVDDLVLILQAGRGVTAAMPERRVLATRRFAELAIDAFRATSPGPPI
ncbi:hypothetical protein B7R22_07520 [Subtercola boreus]|uniref:Uncharacterized protein n=1 Tax=Subtercola boreus TaxID=120213 RepID=A0A3E0VYB7_9MICO|nr:hypothetical protein [Subtercola boreus]RFA15052.1 hypothetical protein B7R22_07520 [Subtercola boreus]